MLTEIAENSKSPRGGMTNGECQTNDYQVLEGGASLGDFARPLQLCNDLLDNALLLDASQSVVESLEPVT
jgi:hypothetical protein